MEEETLCSSLPDNTDSVLQQPQQDSWISTEHHYTNGEQETIVWGEIEVPINQAHGTDLLSLPLKAGPETPEEQWDQMLWSVPPMSCTSPRLSFATVQWDMPNPLTETPSLVTDSNFANELFSDSVTSLSTTSPLLYQSKDDSIGRLTPEEREGRNGLNSCLSTNLEWTGSGSEPCDAADVHEPTTQEQETQELIDGNSEIPLKTESEEEEEEEEERFLVTSDLVETVDLIDTIREIEILQDEVDSVIDSYPEEEQEDPGVLLTGQEDSEEQQTSAKDAEFEEENEEDEEDEEEQNVTSVSFNEESEEATVGWLVEVEVSAELLQTEDAELTLNPEELIEPPQSELEEESQCSETEEDTETVEQLHEDPADQTEEPEMLKDVGHNVDAEQAEEAVDIDEDASKQEQENATRIDDSQEILELIEKLEEVNCSEQQDCDQTASQEREMSPQPEHSECELLEMTEEPEQIQAEELQQIEEGQSGDSNQSGEMELTEESTQPENEEQTEPAQSEETVYVEAEEAEPTEKSEQPPQTGDSSQTTLSENSDKSETTEELSPETEVTQQMAEAEMKQLEAQDESPPQAEEEEEEAVEVEGDVQTVVVNGEQLKASETDVPQMNGGEVDRQMACRLADKLYKLDGVQRVDVVKHLDKDNDFSRAVGEEYLKFFDFSGQTLDHALRSFLKVVVLIGESQERERVLQHFSCRFHQCNPDSFSSSGSVFALTCALMLLNTDLHGQHVGKSMSSSKFVSNLDGMNDGENFNKDLLKSLYNSIKNEPLEWAVDEEELKSSVLVNEDSMEDAPLRLKSNPFLDVPQDKKASVVKEGFLQRKLHADIDGKRTPWGKRGWKTFYGVLRGMVLYLQKDDYKRDQQVSEEVVSVHHSLAEQAADYTKKPYVFRLQTADWRIFLFQASSKVEMNSWISRINLVSALQSSPPFPAAVGSQRKFFRPILPASQSAQTLDRQLQSHTGMLESFKADLLYLQQNPPEGKKTRARDLEEHRVRAEYLQHEMCRYEIYIQVLEGWKSVETTGNNVLNIANLNQFDKAVCEEPAGEEEDEEGALKKSHSSPSLELEIATPTVIKVRRNISERRTYRRTIIPRRNKEA